MARRPSSRRFSKAVALEAAALSAKLWRGQIGAAAADLDGVGGAPIGRRANNLCYPHIHPQISSDGTERGRESLVESVVQSIFGSSGFEGYELRPRAFREPRRVKPAGLTFSGSRSLGGDRQQLRLIVGME